MLLFCVYLLFELSYYLYSRLYIYKALNNTCYNKNRQIITKELSAELCEAFNEYFTNEEDLVKFFTDAFPNKRLLNIENIRKLMAFHIYNRHPNKGYNTGYDDINEINKLDESIDIIK